MGRRAAGFSLIELLIVVAIILIIAAIAIPNFMRSRMAANESASVSYLRAINSASVAYSATYGNGFPPSLIALGSASPATCNTADLLDSVLASGTKSGYNFVYGVLAVRPVAAPGCAAPGGGAFAAQSDPVALGTSGQRSFCVDNSGVIRFDPSGAAFGVGALCPIAFAALQ